MNVSGSSSRKFESKLDTSSFGQKPYIRTGSNIEEDIDMKTQTKIINTPNPVAFTEAATKFYLDKKSNDPSKRKSSVHVNFNEKKPDNVHFKKLNSSSAKSEHASAKFHVNNAYSNSVSQSSWFRLDPDEKLKINEEDSEM